MVRRKRNADLCGFEGAKPRAASEAEAKAKAEAEAAAKAQAEAEAKAKAEAEAAAKAQAEAGRKRREYRGEQEPANEEGGHQLLAELEDRIPALVLHDVTQGMADRAV